MLRSLPDRSGKRSRDVNERAKQLVGEATGEIETVDPGPLSAWPNASRYSGIAQSVQAVSRTGAPGFAHRPGA